MVIPVVSDADTIINSDKYWSYTFECDDATYTTKYDMARTVAHEIGHWVALNHSTNTACATYQIGQMKPFVSLCAAEISAAKSLYGTRP